MEIFGTKLLDGIRNFHFNGVQANELHASYVLYVLTLMPLFAQIQFG